MDEIKEDLWHVVINFHVGSKYHLCKSWSGLMDLGKHETYQEKYNVGVCGFASRYIEDVIRPRYFKRKVDFSVITFIPVTPHVANVTISNVYGQDE